MNINTLQKHYDKLTTRERFALLIAAGARDDYADRAALLSSGPRKTWSIPTTNGIAEGFNFLSMFHVMMQLGYAASYYFLLFHEGEDFKIKDYEYNDAMLLIQRRVLEGREAWRAVCNEYSVDPDKMLEGQPFMETIDILELTVRAANADNPIELSDLVKTIEGYKSAIETKRKEWE